MSMTEEHPTFQNPTIQEALCEIHFHLPDGVEWDSSLYGEFFKRVQSEFPTWEPSAQLGLEVRVGPSGAAQTLLPSQQRMRYRHASRNLVLQLSANILTVNELPKYPGWRQMRQDISEAWAQVCGAARPTDIARIGLRYINRIERTRPEEKAGDWLSPSDYIPVAALSSLPGFVSRLETRPSSNNRLIVTLGEAGNDSREGLKAIVLDIDCIAERRLPADDDALLQEADNLHDVALTVFRASMTPRLRKLLEGGPA